MQNSGPWDPWLLVVENSRLFVQRAHGARCAPYHTSSSTQDFLDPGPSVRGTGVGKALVHTDKQKGSRLLPSNRIGD